MSDFPKCPHCKAELTDIEGEVSHASFPHEEKKACPLIVYFCPSCQTVLACEEDSALREARVSRAIGKLQQELKSDISSLRSLVGSIAARRG